MLPILQLGSLTLRLPGLILLLALWISFEFAAREGKRYKISEDHIYTFGMVTLLAGVLGSRLGFVLFNLDLYAGITPFFRLIRSIFALTSGTELIPAGLLTGAGVAFYMLRRYDLNPLHVIDTYAPGMAIFMIGFSVANLFSGDYYGIPTALPWGIDLWGEIRHPTQVYTLIASLGVFIILWRMKRPAAPASEAEGRKSGKGKERDRIRAEKALSGYQPGNVGQIFLILISLSLFLIEPLRADSPVIGDGFRLWSILTLGGVLAGLGTFAYRPLVAKDDTE